MTAEPDLLPCPGCNGASVRVIGGPGAKGGPQYWAGCDYCRWRTWGNTEAEAIAAWNRRVTAEKDAEIEALRAEVEMLRDAFSDEDMTAGAHWFGRYVEQKRRAERLAEAIRAYKSECDNPAKDYVMRAKRRNEMFAALNPTAAQENDDA